MEVNEFFDTAQYSVFFFKMESRLYDEKEDHMVDSFYLIALDIPEILP